MEIKSQLHQFFKTHRLQFARRDRRPAPPRSITGWASLRIVLSSLFLFVVSSASVLATCIGCGGVTKWPCPAAGTITQDAAYWYYADNLQAYTVTYYLGNCTMGQYFYAQSTPGGPYLQTDYAEYPAGCTGCPAEQNGYQAVEWPHYELAVLQVNGPTVTLQTPVAISGHVLLNLANLTIVSTSSNAVAANGTFTISNALPVGSAGAVALFNQSGRIDAFYAFRRTAEGLVPLPSARSFGDNLNVPMFSTSMALVGNGVTKGIVQRRDLSIVLTEGTTQLDVLAPALTLTSASNKTIVCDLAAATNPPVYSVLRMLTTNGVDGQKTRGGLIEGRDGVLYGNTYNGGAGGYGAILKLNQDGSGYNVLRSFGVSGTPGRSPWGGLFEGADGWLYGTTTAGGGAGAFGNVFKLSKDGSNYLVLHTFSTNANDGQSPFSGVVEGRDGALYGTTSQGGEAGRGTVFKLNTDGSGYAVLRSFTTNSADGDEPWGALVEGRDGALYGTTRLGGTSAAGTVFKLNKDGSGYTVLRRFTGTGGDGLRPCGKLVEGTDGALYGTTQSGGTSGRGTVFKLNPDGTGYAVVHRFASTGGDGGQPYSGMVEGRDGLLYGTCFDGGREDRGTIYRLNKDGSGYSTLRNFSTNNFDARRPFAGLVEGRDGVFYGATEAGGTDNAGAVFRLEMPCALTFDPPTVTSYCCGGDNVTLTILSTVTNGTCPQLITRTWQATDCCSHTATCSQTVTVIDPHCLPVIAQQPRSQTVATGQTAIFSIATTGLPPLQYQWRFNLTNILAGATNATLAVSNVRTNDAGLYDVVVSGPAGSVTSSSATLQTRLANVTELRLVCADGTPLANCLVTLTYHDSGPATGQDTATTDSNGEIQFVGNYGQCEDGYAYGDGYFVVSAACCPNQTWTINTPCCCGDLGTLVCNDCAVTPCCDPERNLVVNGSFEDPVVTTLHYFQYFTTIPAWTGTGSGNAPADMELWNGTHGNMLAQAGHQHLEINAAITGESVSQLVGGLNPLAPTAFSFWYTGRPGFTDNRFTLELVGSGLPVATFNPPAFGVWQRYCVQVPAGPSSLTIQFTDTSASGETGGAHIDNVCLATLAPPPPPPCCDPERNLVVNGSFETDAVSTPDTYDYFATIPGWVGTDSGNAPTSVELWNGTHGGMLAQAGHQHLELNAAITGEFVSQTIATTAGTILDFSFWFTGRPGFTDNRFTIELLGTSHVPAARNPAAFGVWERYCAQVTALSSSVTIRFTDTSASGETGGAHIDNVCLAVLPDQTPMDTDGDGLPDAWEIAHHLNPHDPSDATADLDGDGVNNLDEYRANTEPADPNSRLRLDLLSLGSGGSIQMRFQAMPNRSYDVLAAPSRGSFWTPIHNVPAQPGARAIELTVPNTGEAARFFRVRVN